MRSYESMLRDTLHFRLEWATKGNKSQPYIPWRRDSLMRVFQLRDGHAEIELQDGRLFKMRAGQSYLIPSWQQFQPRYMEDSSGHVRGARFRYEIMGGVDPLQIYRFPFILDEILSEKIAVCTDKLAELGYLQMGPGGILTAARIQHTAMELLEILVSIAKPREDPLVNPEELARLHPAVAAMEQNPDTSPSVQELARLCNLSKSHFADRFKRVFHVTPLTYYRGMRLRNAQRMLLGTQKPLAEIAVELGYSDQSHFTRDFKKALGVSPRDFRQSENRSAL